MKKPSSSADETTHNQNFLEDPWIQDRIPEIYRIAYTLSSNHSHAREVVIRTLAIAVSKSVHPSAFSDPHWLHKQALKLSRSLKYQRQTPKDIELDEFDSRIWKLLETFDERERLLCIFHYLFRWSDAECASVLDVPESAVRTQLSIFARSFQQALADLPADSAIPPAEEHEAKIGSSIRKRFPTPEWEIKDFEALLEKSRSRAAGQAKPKQRIPSISVLLIISGLVLTAACLGVGFLTLLGGVKSELPANQEIKQFLPSVQFAPALPLTWLSNPEEIYERLRTSSQFWKTVWIDIQISDYGPQGYLGAPRVYRSQAWIDQSGQTIELFGLLSKPPSSSYIFAGNRSNYVFPLLGLSTSIQADHTPESLANNEWLRRMVFPDQSAWVIQPGTFRPFDTDRVMNRDTLVVDWFDLYGRHNARLWIDTRTGLILRSQEYDPGEGELLLRESQVTELILNQNFPPARLSTEMRSITEYSPTDQPAAQQQILPTPTLSIEPVKRLSPGIETPPPGFDPAKSRLIFQFSNNLEAANIQSGTAQAPVVLFADGYRLAETSFGLPWMINCQRSPNGYLLAFNTSTDGTSVPDSVLRWLDLRDAEKVYQPAPKLAVESFAFSADSRHVAVFARTDPPENSGIYLIDIALGEEQLVYPVAKAYSLVWSPDGESIAFIGSSNGGPGEKVFQLHIRSKQIAFQSSLPEEMDPLPDEWPMANWGIPFPQEMGGLEQCAKPVH